jgi:2',3'-cyclic-nucleotide 2'-phosphodiesterase (5'-nucleotidase family)
MIGMCRRRFVLLLPLLLLSLWLLQCSEAIRFPKSFVLAFSTINSGGGRRPTSPDRVTEYANEKILGRRWAPSLPQSPEQVKLTILQITDVYTLEHLASFKTLVDTAKHMATSPDSPSSSKVISMLTGDFMAPYLLSSLDRGRGMMNALNQIPLDYITWGNHEADIDHKTVCKHVRTFQGTWINSNMRDHEAMDHQKEFDIIELTSADGSQTRRIGLIAVLSNDPALFAQFKAPGAFGGATLEDPWDTLRHYKTMLEGEPYHCDVVIPLQHLYVPDDHKTCREFDFPVILSGHDHHRVDEVVEGTRLLKPGLDAVYATALELTWENDMTPGNQPTMAARFVKCSDYPPDAKLQEQNERAYDVLLPLRNTELARVPPTFEPLSSKNSRGCVCTMGKFICSLLKSSLNVTRRQRQLTVDAVIIMGGNIRAGTEYPPGSFFSLEALESEVKPEEVVAVVPMPGWLLAKGIQATHLGDPIPGWFQYDSGITQDEVSKEVTHVNGEPLEADKTYRVATKIGDLTNGQSPLFTEYFKTHPELYPPKGSYVNIQAELMSFFARNLWRKIWEGTTQESLSATSAASMKSKGEAWTAPVWGLESPEALQERMRRLDLDGDGEISVPEIHAALRDIVGISVDDQTMSLAEFVHSFADHTSDGKVTMEDLEWFAQEMPNIYQRDKWRLAFARSESKTPVSSAAAL